MRADDWVKDLAAALEKMKGSGKPHPLSPTRRKYSSDRKIADLRNLIQRYFEMCHCYNNHTITIKMNKKGYWSATITHSGIPEYQETLEGLDFPNTDAAFTFCCDLIDNFIKGTSHHVC